MNTNQPLQTLLAANTSKTEAAQNLGATYDTLTKALDEYKDAFATATKTGWAKNDLLRAGFADPAKLRLPREKKTSTKLRRTRDADQGTVNCFWHCHYH